MQAYIQETEQFKNTGVALFRNLIPLKQLTPLQSLFDQLNLKTPGTRQTGLSEELVGQIYSIRELQECAESLVSPNATIVRIIAFDKNEKNNWSVPWHQDRTIAVKEKQVVDNYTVWSKKGNLPHVEPPVEILQNMVTLRIHLDPCGRDNGPLQLIPGSHSHGRLSQAEVNLRTQGETPYIALANTGDVLAMRALTLHKSEKSSGHSSRRVLHLEYSPDQLPYPLEWAIDQG